jgi:hypothetical protein
VFLQSLVRLAATFARMRTKLTALIVACLALLIGAGAQAAPIPVANYTFQAMGDVSAFHRVAGTNCKRKWAGNQALGLTVGNDTNFCMFRSSVIADSSATYADLGMVASTRVSGGNGKLQKKAFVGVVVRRSDTAGYILRVLPNAQKWQYFRDPAGADGQKLEASGSGKFIKGGRKANTVSLRAFANGGATTSVIGSVNGRGVVSTTDSAADQPDGRQTALTTGAKGSGAGTGIMGLFDNVIVQVPNPFG